MSATLHDAFPSCLVTVEAQAFLVAVLSAIGAWVVLWWLVQVLLSIVWPFFVLLAAMILLPKWRDTLTKQLLPKHVEIIQKWLYKGAEFMKKCKN